MHDRLGYEIHTYENPFRFNVCDFYLWRIFMTQVYIGNLYVNFI